MMIPKLLGLFDGDTFWTFEDAEVAAHKINYVKKHRLGGAMVWSLNGDDEEASNLLKAIHKGLFASTRSLVKNFPDSKVHKV